MRRLLALLIGAASLAPAATLAAIGGEDPPMQRVLQFRGQVQVAADGNGIAQARFETTTDGPEVSYVLYVDNAPGTAGHPGPPPVRGLAVTLNEDVVFQNDDEFSEENVEVALNPVGGQLNSIVIAALGAPGSAARVSLVAVGPAPVPFGGVSILPLAMSDAHASTALAIHNVGPSPLAFRIAFLNADGSLAGRTSPRVLTVGATQTLDLGQFVGSGGIPWSRGAVHLQWAAYRFTRLSAAATFHRVPNEAGTLDGVVALDAYATRPLNAAELRDITGE